MQNLEVINNEADNQFEIALDGKQALLRYRKQEGGALEFYHTEVPAEFEGKGVGGKLVKGALEQVKADGKKVVPSCPFVAAYIKRHSEYQTLVA